MIRQESSLPGPEGPQSKRPYRSPALATFGKVAVLTQTASLDSPNDGNTSGCTTNPGNMGAACPMP